MKGVYQSDLKSSKTLNRILGLVILLLVISLSFLGWWHLTKTSSEKQTFIPSNLHIPFSYQNGHYSDAYFRQVAEYFVLKVENYVPESYENLVNSFMEFVHPESRGELKKQFILQYKIIKDRTSSQSFYIKNTIVRGDLVAVVGIRKTFVGSRIVTDTLDAFLVKIETRTDGMITINDYKRAEYPKDPFGDKPH